MRNLLRKTPDIETSDYTTSHQGKGHGYQDRFSILPGRAVMWRLEQKALGELIADVRISDAPDFATGTGRVAEVVKRVKAESRVTGLDVSKSMLEVASERIGKSVDFVLADGRQLVDIFGRQAFDLVTAFRFFPNAEPALREAVAEQIVDVLRPSGCVIVNNHRNFWSPSYIASRTRSGSGAPGRVNSDIVQLFTKRGLRLRGSISLGLWPQSEIKAAFLPWSIAQKLERAAYRCGRYHTAGYNTLFLFST